MPFAPEPKPLNSAPFVFNSFPMQSLPDRISDLIRPVLQELFPEGDFAGNLLSPTQNSDFGDYQCNIAMKLAKALKKKPRDIASDILEKAQLDSLIEKGEIAGPGFINLWVKLSVVQDMAVEMGRDQRLGIPEASQKLRILVDFSSPNLAKEMHVGHLRSTIIGDAIARFLEFEGHEVLRMNHVGDWGTQFGMLLQYLRESQPEAADAPEKFQVHDLEGFYRKAKQKFDQDEDFANRSRKAVVELQSGNEQALTFWKAFCHESLRHCEEIYQMLNIRLTNRGESFYNDFLPKVIESLSIKKLLAESEGAQCVFLDGYTTREGDPLPMIVQKSDGGYNYETTDLAAIHYRTKEDKSDRIIYVTDSRQKQHFDMVFKTAELLDWAPGEGLIHAGFGMMLGDDGRPFRTRDGGTVKLKDLLNEAKERAKKLATELSPELEGQELETVAETVGWGGVKYADLSHDRMTDYKFSWDKMLSTDGNSAAYILITHARTRSIGRKGGVDTEELLQTCPILLREDTEIRLAHKCLATMTAWRNAVQELAPNLLLTHLFELCRDFASFWNQTPVWKEEDEDLRNSRLALCGLVGKITRFGLEQIGIQALERL